MERIWNWFEKTKKLRGNMFFKMMFLYCTFTFVIIYILANILRYFSEENISQKTYLSNLNKLSMMQVYCDANVMQKINDIILGIQIQTDGKIAINNFMQTKGKLNEGELYNTYQELNTVILDIPIISSLELYNRANNIFLSSGTGVDYNPDSTKYVNYFNDGRGPMWIETNNGATSVINTFHMYAAPEEKTHAQ